MIFENIKLNKNGSTHMPMLIKTVQMSDGPILEIGAGIFSTSLLHWLCHEKKRRVVTYESNPDFFSFAKGFQSKYHSIRFVNNYDEVDVETHWGVVFIDHSAERRAIEIDRLKYNADYIVIHDTEAPVYGYDKIWQSFKYHYDWKNCAPWTSVVSNFKDLSFLQEISAVDVVIPVNNFLSYFSASKNFINNKIAVIKEKIEKIYKEAKVSDYITEKYKLILIFLGKISGLIKEKGKSLYRKYQNKEIDMISICIATRKRGEMFKNFCQSVLDTANEPDKIEFVVYKGIDDTSPYEYVGNHKIILGENLGFDGGIDKCQKIATGPIYGFFPDDVIFESKGWDKMVRDAFDNSPDKIIFVFANDHYARSNFGAMGFLHKNWIDTVGHFLVPSLVRRGDCWLNTVAKAIGRKHYLRNMRTKNFYVETDETHQDYLKLISETQPREKYYSKEMKDARARDINLLNDFIDKHKKVVC